MARKDAKACLAYVHDLDSAIDGVPQAGGLFRFYLHGEPVTPVSYGRAVADYRAAYSHLVDVQGNTAGLPARLPIRIFNHLNY